MAQKTKRIFAKIQAKQRLKRLFKGAREITVKPKVKRAIQVVLFLFILLAVFFVSVNLRVNRLYSDKIYTSQAELPEAYTGLVLGAYVYPDGTLSDMTRDRADTAIELYNQDKIKRILISGDHGQKDYDEVNTIKNYMLEKGIPGKDIFLDHAGFNTYNSMYRAREIFQVDKVVIITQEFHLPRAVYIARELGLDATGIKADKWEYAGVSYNYVREFASSIRAFLDVTFQSKPKFLGEKIPITGESKKSWD